MSGADDEKKRSSVEWVAERMKNSSKGRITSEEAHREVAKVQRDLDRKNADRKPTKKKD